MFGLDSTVGQKGGKEDRQTVYRLVESMSRHLQGRQSKVERLPNMRCHCLSYSRKKEAMGMSMSTMK